jgi:hypothetical protein
MYTLLTIFIIPDDYTLPHISKYHDQLFVPSYICLQSLYDGVAVENGILRRVPVRRGFSDFPIQNSCATNDVKSNITPDGLYVRVTIDDPGH